MLLPTVLAYLLGLCLADGPTDFAKLVLATASLGFSSLLIGGSDALHSKLWAAPLAACAFAAGLATSVPASAPLLTRGPATFVGTVETEVVKLTGRNVTVRVKRREDGVPLPAGVRVRVMDCDAPVGGVVRVSGELVPSLAYRNDGPHPSWPDARPSAAVVPARDTRRVTLVHVGWFDARIAAARDATRRALFASLRDRTAGVAAALVLGDGAMLEESDAASIKGAGLTHVLAVSGTHIAMVGGAFVMLAERLLRRVRRVLEPARVAAALGIPFAMLHAVFAGSVPSGMRAAVTASVAWTLVAAGRRPDALEATALATLVLALPSPADATRPGFLLSVVATIAVVTAPKPADDSLRASVAAAWSLTWRSAVTTAPIVIHGFGDVPLASLAANLLLVPLGSIGLLPLSLVHALVACTNLDAATYTAALFEPCSSAFLEGSAAFAAVEDGVRLPPTTVLETLVLATVSMLVVARTRRPPAWVGLLLVAVYAGEELRLRLVPRLRGTLELHQLDIGQGDAALLRFPDGRYGAIDFGPDRPDAGDRVVAPMLRALRVPRLDLAVLTHRHPDHYGGLASTAAAIPITALFEPGEADDENAGGTAADVLRRVARGGTRVLTPSSLCGRPRRFGGARVELLAPCPRPRPGFSLNDASMVVRITFGAHSFLWVGDAERLAEEELLALGTDLRATVLKVGHHGSRTSSTGAFIRAVRPVHAVLSAGPGNRFGHPHRETLETLARQRVRLHRTDLHGGVRFESDGRQLSVTHGVD